MNCPRCKAPLNNGATFCSRCGKSMIYNARPQHMNNAPGPNGYNNRNNYNNYNNRNNNYRNNSYNNKKKNNDNVIMIIAAVVAAIVLCIATAVVTFSMWSDGGLFAKPTPTPEPTPTPAPTAEPTPMPTPTAEIIYVTEEPVREERIYVVPDISNLPQNPEPPVRVYDEPSYSGYKTYYSGKYDFSCDYPANFHVYDDGGTLTLYTVSSADGSAREKIVATPNNGETPRSELNSFVANHGGNVEYSTVGSDYFACRIDNGTTEYYRYCKFRNGNLYWFDFESPSSQHDFYDVIINHVYGSMSY